jgi:hypothetical protein
VFDVSVFICSAAAIAVATYAMDSWLKGLEWCAASSATPPSDDDDDLAGLRVGECCVIPYNGGELLGVDCIPAENPVYFVPDEADARAVVAVLLRAEARKAGQLGTSDVWHVRRTGAAWWFARAHYSDDTSVAVVARLLPPGFNVPVVWSVLEAEEYLDGLRTSGDRRGMPQ